MDDPDDKASRLKSSLLDQDEFVDGQVAGPQSFMSPSPMHIAEAFEGMRGKIGGDIASLHGGVSVTWLHLTKPFSIGVVFSHRRDDQRAAWDDRTGRDDAGRVYVSKERAR